MIIKDFTLIRTLRFRNFVNAQRGFTLIELLVVLSILGILIGLTLFGVGPTRGSARDAKRKSDLELIRGAIEAYRADCHTYPSGNGDPTDVLATDGLSLTGDGSPTSCASANVYMREIPDDPRSPNSTYRYYSNGTVYEVCAALEQVTVGVVTCGNSSNCGAQYNCNYKVVNP